MKYKTITVSFGTTISTGDYSNMRPEISFEVELDETEQGKVDDITDELLFSARYAVAESILPSMAVATRRCLKWLRDYSTKDGLREGMISSVDLFRWLNLNAPMMADDYVDEAWDMCRQYEADNNLPFPTPSDGVSDIPF
jgi:hypothetical protein